VALNYTNASTLSIYWNNPDTPIVAAFDPNDTYNGVGGERLVIGSRCSAAGPTSGVQGIQGMKIARVFDVYGGLTGGDPTLEDLFTQLNSQFNIGASW
jgi:hypothetical protein